VEVANTKSLTAVDKKCPSLHIAELALYQPYIISAVYHIAE